MFTFPPNHNQLPPRCWHEITSLPGSNKTCR